MLYRRCLPAERWAGKIAAAPTKTCGGKSRLCSILDENLRIFRFKVGHTIDVSLYDVVNKCETTPLNVYMV